MKIQLSFALRKIGRIRLDSLDNRINFQKTIYLLKEMGAIKEHYHFSWYIFGPYSSEAAKDGFNLINDDTDKIINVSEDFDDKINKFKELKGHGGREIKWLELLSCIHYIRKKETKEKDEVFKILKTKKPYFDNINLFNRGWKTVNAFFSS